MTENMEQPGSPSIPNPLTNKHPPIWQELVIELFFRPGKFFSDLSILMQTRYIVAVTFVFGLSDAIDNIDQEMLKASLKADSGRAEFIAMITDTWINYWGFVIVYGSISAVFLWWIGGWWYRKRLEWSGAVDPDHRLARVVYIYASFVLAAPIVISSLIYTTFYDSYTEAYNADELWSLLILIFPFWSLVTSYIGIRTTFEVSKWKASIWFVILPGLLYITVFGGVAALFMLMEA